MSSKGIVNLSNNVSILVGGPDPFTMFVFTGMHSDLFKDILAPLKLSNFVVNFEILKIICENELSLYFVKNMIMKTLYSKRKLYKKLRHWAKGDCP